MSKLQTLFSELQNRKKIEDLALFVAISKNRQSVVLAYKEPEDTQWWPQEFEAIGSNNVTDIGIKFSSKDYPEHAGLYVWEGYVRLFYDGEYVDDHQYIGKWRDTTDVEVKILQSGILNEHGWIEV